MKHEYSELYDLYHDYDGNDELGEAIKSLADTADRLRSVGRNEEALSMLKMADEMAIDDIESRLDEGDELYGVVRQVALFKGYELPPEKPNPAKASEVAEWLNEYGNSNLVVKFDQELDKYEIQAEVQGNKVVVRSGSKGWPSL